MLSGIGKYGVTAAKEGGNALQLHSPSQLSSSRTNAVRQARKTMAGFASGSGIPGTAGTPGGFASTGAAVTGLYNKAVLDDYLAHNDEHQMRQQYRDIYLHDSISGSAIDLMSDLPFSDFTLSGLPNQDMLKVYAQSMDAINIKLLLPEATRSYNVYGAFVGVTNFDKDQKRFTSLMPQDINMCQITPLPIYGRDPIIDLKIPPEIKKLIQNNDPRIMKAFSEYGESWKKMAQQATFPLEPADTLYLPRRTFATNALGTSLLRRILPVWLIEKALLRGTIDLAWRRQRAVLQIIAGDEDWEPTNAELTEIVNMFIQADVDPTGAIVGTRPGISVQEFRQGGDFWRWDEMYDVLASVKMRSLGISDAFLSSEATLSNMETSLSVFLDQIRAYRELITRKIFYQRLFPIIAQENGFFIEEDRIKTTGDHRWVKERKGRNGKVEAYATIGSGSRYVHISDDNEDIDVTKLYMPRLQWHKTLKPEADQSYLEILATLQGAGLPIPLRMWAAAGGMSITEVMSSLQDDVKLRKKVAKYQGDLPKSAQDQAAQMFQQAALRNSYYHVTQERDRTFDNLELRDPKTHKVLSRKGKALHEERFNRKASQALANVAQRDNHTLREAALKARKRTYAYKRGLYGNTDTSKE